jgi:hypothetical protein
MDAPALDIRVRDRRRDLHDAVSVVLVPLVLVVPPAAQAGAFALEAGDLQTGAELLQNIPAPQLLLTYGLSEAERKAGGLEMAFDRERQTSSLPGSVGLSIGVAAVSKEADSLRDAIRDADTLMYRDKLAERA